MKHLKLILVLAISTIAISCGNDDDGGPSGPTLTAELLAGTYNLNSYTSTEVIRTSVSGGTVTTTITETADTFGSSNIVFNANGTYTLTFQYRIVEIETLENNDPIEDSFIVSFSDSGNYSVNDDDQTLTIDGEVNDVTLFNSNELRLEYMEAGEDGDEEFTFSEELRFSRQ